MVYACVSAVDAENIRILGRGILDNSHNKEEILYEVSAEGNDSAVNNASRRRRGPRPFPSTASPSGIRWCITSAPSDAGD